MVMGREPAVRPQRGRYPSGVCDKEVGANSIWFQGCATRDNFRCPTCVRGLVAVRRRLEVGKDSLEIVHSFRYLGDVISYEGGLESAVRDSLCWSKLRKLVILLVNHSIPIEE